MSSSGLRGAFAIGAMAAAFVVGFATGRGCSRVAVTPPAVVENAPQATHSTVHPGADRPAGTGQRIRTSTPDAVDAIDTSAQLAPERPALEGEDFPFVDVEVVDADGNPAYAIVYCLAAGASCDERTPFVETDDVGRARLHVVAAGRYDVGARVDWNLLHALATDVDVPRTRPLKIALPRDAAVSVVYPAELAPAKAEDQGESRYEFRIGIDGESRSEFPGREEVPAQRLDGRMFVGKLEWKGRIPQGVRCRIQPSDPHVIAEPESFTAPAEIRLSARDLYPVHVKIQWKGATRVVGHPCDLAIHFATGEGPSRREFGWNTTLAGNASVAEAVPEASVDETLAAPSGVLHWSGEGITPGSTEFRDLSPTQTTTLVAPVEFDPRRELPPAADRVDPSEERTFRVKTVGPPELSDVCVYVDCGEGGVNGGNPDEGGVLRLATKPELPWAFAMSETHVSRFVKLSPGADDVSLELVRGGHLVLVPTAMPPKSLRVPEIARCDGLPICGPAFGVENSAAIDVGLVLGPLPPGRVDFQVTLAGRVVAKVGATVVAGVNTPLVIPHLRAADVAAPK